MDDNQRDDIDDSLRLIATNATKDVRKWLHTLNGQRIEKINWDEVLSSFHEALNYIDDLQEKLNRATAGAIGAVYEHPLYRKDYFDGR